MPYYDELWKTIDRTRARNEREQEGGGSTEKEADVNDNAVTALNEISPEILRGVKLWVKNSRTPHDIGHAVAHNYPDMGAAFYRIVEEAAEELYKEADNVPSMQ